MAGNEMIIQLFNEQRETISNATFYLTIALNDPGIPLEPEFDPGAGVYIFKEVPEGAYILEVRHKDYQSRQQQVVLIKGKQPELVFTLSAVSQPFFIQGSKPRPYQPLHEERVIILFNTALSPDNRNRLEATIKKLGLEEIHEPTVVPGGRLFRLTEKRTFQGSGKKIIAALEKQEGILQVASVLEAGDKKMIVLTNEITVKFKDRANYEQIKDFLERYQLTISRNPRAVNLYRLNTPSRTSRELLELCDELRFDPLVEKLDSNITSTYQLAALTIADYLFEEQWDFKLIDAHAAWEALQNDPQRAAKGNTAFGNPEVIMAVCDVGTDISHSDLSGQLSNGAAKIGVVFDFHHMVPNMDKPGSSHGTACTSVATAITNTQEGVAGIAGNSQLMAIQLNPMPHETDADLIEWVAGIDPGNPAFPAVPKGASVMSNSWSRIMPSIPLDVAAAIDRVTTYGRQGKGTLLFFAAGNDHSFYEPNAPYATHPKVAAISASTVDENGKNEIFTSYSNFGAGIDFCVPTKDGIFDTHPASCDGFTAAHSPFSARPFGKTTIAAGSLPEHTRPNSIKVDDAGDFILALSEALDVIIKTPGHPDAERFTLIDVDPLQDILTLDRPWIHPPLPGDQVLRVDGNCPGNGSTQTTLAADAIAGQIIQVSNIALFSAGKAVMINPGTPQSEAHAIRRIEPATSRVFLMTDLRHPANCKTGTPVDVGPADYQADFSGTSYATPVCAGIAALCLAANKNLSWVEVRDLMRLTARKINIGETGITITPGTFRYGKWRDRSGKDIVSDTGQLNPLDPRVETTNFSLNNTRDVLFLGSAFGFEIGQAIAVTGQGHDGFNHRDFRIVIGAERDALLLDSPLSATFIPLHVEAGLKPYYSAFYGYGRVDAGKAVEAALDSVTNYQHLVIRNHLQEDGTPPTALIQSPDLWVTNSALTKVGEVYTLYRSATGPDDFSHTDFKYDGGQNAMFYIEIDSTSPGGDTYRWARNGETVQEKVPIGSGMKELEDNFFIGFNSPIAHRIGDNWTVFIDRIETAMDYTRDAPHENPGIDNERYIHARIKNLVSSPAAANLTNHDCRVRFYIALSSGKTANATAQGTGFDSNFYFSSTGKNNDWDDTTPIHRIATGLPATYFVGEVAIPEGVIAPADHSDPSTGTHIVSIPWKVEDLPPATLDHSIFLMVHIAPFHGQVNGNGAHNNSCLSYREIAFADFFFTDQAGIRLENKLEVDPFGSPVTQAFIVDAQTEIGQLLTEKLSLEIVRIDDNGTEAKAVFRHDGTAWTFDPANPAWPGLIVNAPVVSGTDHPVPATGPQKEISFTGEFQASKEHKQIIIRPQVVSKHSTAIIAAKVHEVDILQSDELPTGIDSALLKKNPPPRSHAFADMTNLNQGADQSFGPIAGQETDSFRATSLFSANTDTNAYAITDGFVFLQPGADPNTVNLIIRPFKQPVIGFTPVKYFVYRGLRIADFLDPSNETKVLPDHVSNSEFIKRQRAIFTAQQAPGADFLSKALGYDRDNQDPATLLDSYFFKGTPGMQLPFVTRGTQLGRFLHTNNYAFGLDILLEEGSFTTTLAYVRKKAHIISVHGMGTGTDAARLLKKLRQEEILNFLDPAAFYGMHLTRKGTVDTRNAAGETDHQKSQKIYEEVVNKFHTRNKVYLDIRNENGNSYNFYGNYKGAAGTPDAAKNIKMGTSGTQLVSQMYQTHGWPVMIEDRPAQNTTADSNQLHCALRFDDNTKPMLYVEEGIIGARPLPSSSSAFIDTAELGDAAAAWTAGVGFDIPNTGPSGAKLNMATIVKLFYGRNITSTTWPDTVLKTESPTDNVFGPLDLTPLWKSDSQIKWITAQDKKYVDLTDRGYIAERGVALDGSNNTGTGNGRVVFFGVANDYYPEDEHQNRKGITGGVSTKLTFFEAAGFFQGLKLFFDQLILPGSTINTLQLIPATGEALPPDALLLLCISRSELETLKALPGFHSSYPRYARIDKVEEATDSNNKPYVKYQLKVQGLDANGKYKLAATNTAIFVYSVDGFLYFSDAYSKDEPLPTTYNRTAEENIGALLSDDKLLSWEDFFINKDQLGVTGDVQEKAHELVRNFIDGINAIPNDAQADSALQQLINNQPKALFQRMCAFVDHNSYNNPDDRILYWSRIKMKVALQSHALLLQSFSSRNSLLEQFETVTRGYGDIDFSKVPEGVKKILLVGFDPYFLQPHEGSAHNTYNSNPSGAVALALHDGVIPDPNNPGRTLAFVQSAIFPIRFADYDKQEGQGIVEEYLNRFIDPTVADYSPVDAIMVMDKYQPDAFMVARFTARRRGARRDNNFQHSAEIPLTITGDEFYEATLPIGDSFVGLHFEHSFNQAYEYRIKATKAIKKFTKEKWVGDSKISNNPDGNDPANLLPVNQPSADIKAIRGAVDPYFANEVFYRICALRDKKNKVLKAGLLLLPRLQGTNAELAKDKKLKKDFDPALTKQVIEEVIQMISIIAPTNL